MELRCIGGTGASLTSKQRLRTNQVSVEYTLQRLQGGGASNGGSPDRDPQRRMARLTEQYKVSGRITYPTRSGCAPRFGLRLSHHFRRCHPRRGSSSNINSGQSLYPRNIIIQNISSALVSAPRYLWSAVIGCDHLGAVLHSK